MKYANGNECAPDDLTCSFLKDKNFVNDWPSNNVSFRKIQSEPTSVARLGILTHESTDEITIIDNAHRAVSFCLGKSCKLPGK